MSSKERRKLIEEFLIKRGAPQKGQDLAKELGVTRQVIVKDIAILRAEGINIIATPEGYMIPKDEKHKIKRVIAVCHNPDEIEDELTCIVKFGGTIENVIIEHPLYGEMRGMLMIKTLYDVQNFMEKCKKYKAEPLSALTRGVHIHTIEADDKETMERIIKELKNKKYIISD
ncbi:transcription repressor NadR [Clostridium sp. SYSU_GA19001]|uniref:transcription repressor NadR n=1 Tax=Clostridium caldaquaticum TaxID=2940653 RepID=UPI002076D7E2|nr:transcription repressor NadR [Clostridium caldaquaticum]MCM8711347.1 transcription repressor NadR [Clostridium caldaquaticum]